MNKESQQLLRDASIKPTMDIVNDCLGAASKVYKKFLEEIKNYDILLMDWRYYHDAKAWLSKGEYHWKTSRGNNKIKPLFWLTIWNGYFKVSFNFLEKTKDQLLLLPIREDTKERIKESKLNGNKIKFLSVIFDVDDEKQLYDIFLLAKFRKENI